MTYKWNEFKKYTTIYQEKIVFKKKFSPHNGAYKLPGRLSFK